MLLLVTILLVVVGAISLVIGYSQSETVPIFVSIGCSIVAGALLLIFTRKTAKTQRNDDSSSGSPAPRGFAPSERTEAVPAMAGTGFLGRSSPEETFAADDGDGGGTGAGAAALTRYEDDDPSVDDDFPIDRYDSRRVGELLPLLAELDVDELDVVREREERGKGRATVLARIDQLIEQLEDEDRDEAEHRFDAPAADGHDDHDDTHGDLDDHDDEVRPAASPVRVAALPMDDDYFPIEDYDDLRASEILPLLPELDDDELDMVRERERTGSGRSSILHRIDALLEVEPATAGPGPVPHEDDVPEPEPEPMAVPSAPVRKARATRAPATKAPPVKAPAVKAPAARTAKAAPVKAAVAKAPSKAPRVTKVAPAVKAARAPAPVAPVAKAPARRAPAARASVPAAAPVKASAPAKVAKAPAQKRTATPSSTPASKTTRKSAKR